jgi:hypothetical protein
LSEEEKEETLPAGETEEEEVEKLAEKIIEGEEGGGEESGEAPEEYIPAEELEPLPPGALDVRAIEIMADISELLDKVVSGSLPESKAVKEVLKLRKRLVPRRSVKASSKSKSTVKKSSKKSKSK